jgi:hypothetical protein
VVLSRCNAAQAAYSRREKMETKFKTSKPVEATASAPTLRFSAAAEAVLGRQTEIAPNALSQVTHAMRYQ